MPPEIAAAIGLELLAALAHAHGERRRASRRQARERAHRARDAPTPRSRRTMPNPRRGPARRRQADRLRDRQAPRRPGRDVDRAGARKPRPHGARADRRRGGRRPVGRLRRRRSALRVHGRSPAVRRHNPAQVLRRVLDGHYTEAQPRATDRRAAWSKILDRALAHAPADRFADANAMRDAVAAELERLDVTSPERDLEAWIDDPRSVERGQRRASSTGSARSRATRESAGMSSRAAADYNRALAYAPDDPNLLRIVAGMNRAERRARALRRFGRVGAAVAVALHALVRGAAARPATRPSPPRRRLAVGRREPRRPPWLRRPPRRRSTRRPAPAPVPRRRTCRQSFASRAPSAG